VAQTSDLWSSLWQFDGNMIYDGVELIKVVIKELTGHTELQLKNVEH